MGSSPSPLSGSATPADPLSTVARFDRAWANGHAPNLGEFLPADVTGEARLNLLVALVRADLVRRWERPGTPPLLEWYCGKFPELGNPERLPIDLIVEEYAARLRRGERPSMLDYMDRFPNRDEVVPALEAVDPERTVDARARLDTLSNRSGDTQAMPPDPAAGLVEAVKRLGVLSQKQLDALRTGPRAPRELCEWMIRQNWITPFQAERLLDDGTGLVIGPYLILEPIGEGRAGKVFRAIHRTMRRVAAVKVLRHDDGSTADEPDPEAYRRFLKEIEAVGRLDNPHIVHTYDAGQHDGAFYLAMEYGGGTDLKRLVEKHGPLRVLHAVEYARQAAIGLQHAADNGLVHRDVKPGNLLLTRPSAEWPMGCIKLLDLGIARVHKTDPTDDRSHQSHLTEEGELIGTADYMSPEQAINARGVDVRSDLYSLGCTLYFLLTGKVPYPGGTPVQKSLRHARDPVPPVWKHREDVPLSVCRVVERLMAKKPDDRYPTATEAAAAMSVAVAELSMPAEDPFASIVAESSPVETCPATSKPVPVDTPASAPTAAGLGYWWWAIGGGGVVILGGLALLVSLLSPSPPARTEPDDLARPTTPEPPAFRGTGLLGTYYPAENFTGNSFTRVDPVVDFAWTTSRRVFPASDRLAVAWVGEVETVESGDYQFQTVTSDGVRLYVQGRKVIDVWRERVDGPQTSAKIRLPARTRVPLRFEFFNKGTRPIARLMWERPTRGDFDVILRQFLHPVPPAADSRVDFSDKQDQNGWSYVYRKVGGSGGPPEDGLLKWDNNTWRGPAENCFVTQDGIHPGDGIWTGRRWKARSNGHYRAFCTLAKLDTAGGDGVAGVVLVNGEERNRSRISHDNANGVTYTVELALKAGDAVDFLVDPMQNNGNDHTLFNVVIAAK